MKIYGMMTTNTERVLVTMAEKGEAPRYELVNLALGEQRQPPHQARHPFGKIPALVEDDGFTLFESRAIMRYLDQRLDGPLLTPGDARRRALMEQWLSAVPSYVGPAAGVLRKSFVWGPMMGLPVDAAEVARAQAELGTALDVFERALTHSRYLTGETLSLADLDLLCELDSMVRIAAVADIVHARRNVQRWLTELTARPAWQAVLVQRSAAEAAFKARRATPGAGQPLAPVQSEAGR